MQIFLSCSLVDMLFCKWGYLFATYSKPVGDTELAELYEKQLQDKRSSRNEAQSKYTKRLSEKILKRGS